MRLFISTAIVAVVMGSGCGRPEAGSIVQSLTDDDYTGSKYYYGWGAVSRYDPAMMHNEVRYDVLHTHGIFTEDVGGNYEGMSDIGSGVNGDMIRDQWDEIGAEMTDEDMYVQYSSGHGYATGLAVGVSYNEIRDNALSYPAQEVIIFTMACQSGGLVDSFNSRRDDWSDWQESGRNLMVMASSRTSENSSTGPGRDEDEPGGPYGSAGSAFGHALWKALIGYADGYIDGVEDGYLSLEEIIAYTIWKTQRVGGHTPQITGSYDSNLIMNRVPSDEFLLSIAGGTEGMSDAQVTSMIQQIDRQYRL